MIKFFAFTDSEIHNKQKIINFAHKFHKKFPKYTLDSSDMMKTLRMDSIFRMLGVNHFRLVAKYDETNHEVTFYKQVSPVLNTVHDLKNWLSKKSVHICMGLTGLPVSFYTMWNRVFHMNKKSTGYALSSYPGAFEPQFHARPSEYVIAKQIADKAANMIVFSRRPGKKFHKYMLVPHVYSISNKRSINIAKRLWKDIYQTFGNGKNGVQLPMDEDTQTLLLQEFVKEYRLVFIKMNDFFRPVVYTRAAYDVPLDIGMLESDRYRVEEWKDGYSPVSKRKVLHDFINNALIPNFWFKKNNHKPPMPLHDFGGHKVSNYRYLYDLRVPSVTNKGAYSMLEFDIVPGEKPITDKKTNEVLRPMPKSKTELKQEIDRNK